VATRNQVQPADAIVAAVKGRLLHDIDAGRPISGAHAAQLHRAIDLLRAGQGDPIRLATVEKMSCVMHPMPHLLRQGRVNAYASAVLKLRRAVTGL